MTRLVWDEAGSRYFEAGVSHGVLYVDQFPAVPWNGLTGVTHNPVGGDPQPRYMDGVKFSNDPLSQEFRATLKAYTYPEEFEACEGTLYNSDGLGFGDQPQKPFGLSYQTRIGNDIDGIDHGYKIHVLYNATVTPSGFSGNTLGTSIDPYDFTWDISCLPAVVSGVKPTAHFIIDSRKTKPDTLEFVERSLYGSPTSPARLPSSTELVTLFELYRGFQIIENPETGLSRLDYQGEDDLVGDTNQGLYLAGPSERLTPTTEEGYYTLE